MVSQPLPEQENARDGYDQKGCHTVHGVNDDRGQTGKRCQQEFGREIVWNADQKSEAPLRFSRKPLLSDGDQKNAQPQRREEGVSRKCPDRLAFP